MAFAKPSRITRPRHLRHDRQSGGGRGEPFRLWLEPHRGTVSAPRGDSKAAGLSPRAGCGRHWSRGHDIDPLPWVSTSDRKKGDQAGRQNGSPRPTANGSTRRTDKEPSRPTAHGSTRRTEEEPPRQAAHGSTRKTAEERPSRTAHGSPRKTAEEPSRQAAYGSTRRTAEGRARPMAKGSTRQTAKGPPFS